MTTSQPNSLPVSGSDFDLALTGNAAALQLDDQRVLPLHTQRWQRPVGRGDRWLLDRCHGTTLDLGCGPGRLTAELMARGVPAMGADSSAVAVRSCRDRGAPAVQADVFGPLPREGRWRTVLLADGNIGIGGDPLRLLHRARTLLSPNGSLLIETASGQDRLWRGQARVRDRHGRAGTWFPWAILGLAALPLLADAARLLICEVHQGRDRQFARLCTRPAAPDLHPRRRSTPGAVACCRTEHGTQAPQRKDSRFD